MPITENKVAPSRGILQKTKRVGVSSSTTRLNGIFYHTGTQKVYSANSATNNVTIFNANTFELLATIAFTGAQFIFYVNSINEIWVTSNNTLILRIDPTTNASLGTFAPVSANMREGFYYSASKVFVCNITLNRLDVINPATFATDANVATQTAPRNLHLHPTLGRIFVPNQTTNSISIIDPATNTNVANVSLAGILTNASYLCYVTSLDKYFITDAGSNRIVTGTPAAATIAFDSPIRLPDGYITRACVYIPEQDVVVITASSVNLFWELFVFDVQTNKIIYNWLINATGIAGATPSPLGLTYNNDLKEVIAGAEQHGRLECFRFNY
jgi:YVTN family beta-propeller protein